jgi:hypothetical protein
MISAEQLRDWMRGYSAADIENVRAKIQDHRAEFLPGEMIRVSIGEMRALVAMEAHRT